MKKLLLLFSVLSLPVLAAAQMTTRVVCDSLFIPWEMVFGPDKNIWFTQKNGYICRLEPASGKIDTLYHETNTAIQSEGGMLGLALHPDFANSPFVYVAYNYMQAGDYKERIVRYSYSNNTLGSPFTLLDNIDGANFHNGCRLEIVVDKLFITTGDATNSSISQDVGSINGKTLRINLDGSIPGDNPIAGSAVWSWGHRNAQGLVYANGRLYSSEHGDNVDDEVNIVEKGRNYGWPTVKGFCNTPAEITFCNDSNVLEPLQAWTPTIAVSGLDYYNNPMFPAFANSLLMATLKDQSLYQLKLNNTFDAITSATKISGVSFGRLRAICISPEGRIYLSTSNSNASGNGTRVDKIIELYDPSYVPPGNVGGLAGNSTVIIYPNPVNNVLQIRLAQSSAATLSYRLTDVSGKLVMSGTLTSQTNDIGTGKLSPGIYQVQVLNGNDVLTTQKILKQ